MPKELSNKSVPDQIRWAWRRIMGFENLSPNSINRHIDNLTKSKYENISSLSILVEETARRKSVEGRIQLAKEEDHRLLKGIAKVHALAFLPDERGVENPTVSHAAEYILQTADQIRRGVISTGKSKPRQPK